MQKKGVSAILVIVILLVVAGGVYLYIQNQNSSNTNNQGNPNNSIITTVPNATGTGIASTPQTYNIAIMDFAFNPASLTIHAGDTVIWTNQDTPNHIIASDSGTELASSSLSTGKTYSHTFSSTGTFAYHCAIHPSMKGTITVQ